MFGTLCSFAANAAISLDYWRNELSALRVKAENNAPQAYLEAKLLQNETPAGVTPADRARILNLLSRIELHLALISESVRHSEEAKIIAKQGNDADGQIEADLNIALGAINQGRLDDMVAATQDGMGLLETIPRDDLRAEMMFQAAMMYLRFGQLEETTTVAMQALEVAKNSDNPWVHAYAEQSMGVAYYQSGRYADARGHYRNMLDTARQAHLTLLEATAILGLSSVAGGMGDNGEAERLNKEATELFRRVGAPFYICHAQHQLANMYVGNKQPERALPLLDDNAKTYEAHDNLIGLWWTLQLRSHAQQVMGRLAQARKDAERAYTLAQKIGFNVYMGGSAQRLAEVSAAQGDYKDAYRWYADAAALKENADREKAGKRILDQAKRYREESKQRRIDELNRHGELQDAQQRQMQIGLVAVVSLLGVTFYFLLRLRKSRSEIRSLNVGLEQRVLERTMELLESRQSLAEAQRIAHVGSWEMNLLDNVLTWSEEVYRIFEIAPQQFGASYEAFMDSVHPDDREGLDSAFKASLENREPFEIEHRLLFPDGRIKYVHEHCETFYSADGRPLRSIGTVQDITERKEMENALHESRQLLTEAQRIAHVGSWELDIVSNKLIWTDESYRIFEIDPQQVSVTYEVFLDTIHPEDRDTVNRVYLASLESRTPYEIVHRLLFPDGRIKFVHEHCETFYSADGRPLRSIGTTQDITVRKEMENALRESQQLMAEAQRIAQVGSWKYDIASDIHTWSDELFRIYEIDPVKEGASYEGCFNATHPDDRDAITRLYLNSVETGQPYESEHRLLMADGRIKHVHERCETICGPDGTLLRAVGMMQDITERKLAEQKLKEALEFSDGVINAIPDILFELDRDGRYLNVWTQKPELLAAQREALLGKTFHEVLSSEAAAASMEAMREADETGYVQGKDICIDLPQGRRWFSHTISKKIGGVSGKVTFLALSRDITERKLLEQALAERERDFRSLAGNMPDNVARWDTEGRYLYINPTHERLLGRKLEELAGQPIPDSHAHVKAGIAQVVATGQATHAVRQPVMVEGIEELHDVSLVPEFDASGKVVSVLGIGRDMTERYRMQETIAAREQEFRSLAESSPDFIVRYDRKIRHRYLNSNLMRKLGLSSMEEVLGKRPSEVWTDGRFSGIEKAATWAVESGQMQELEMSAPDENGGVRNTQISVVPERDTSGNIIGSIAFGRDITAIREAERKLSHFIDNLPGMAFTFRMSPDGKLSYTYLSQAADEFYGMTVDQVMADFGSTYSLVPEEDRERIGVAIMESARDMCPKIFEFRIRRQGVPERWLESRSLPERQTDGSTLWYGIMLDITERKRMEAALQESEARYRYHFNQLQSMLESAASVSVFALDRDYCYLFFNNRHREGAKRLRGTDIEIGMNMVETIPDPEFREFCRRGFDRVLAGHVVSVESKEKVVKDGVTTYEYNDNYGSPIFNDAGKVVGLTVFAINTTERKRLEAELRDSRNFLDSVIDAVPDPIFVKDRQHRWVLLNDANCRFTGLPREALVGKSDYDIFPEEQAAEFWEKDELVFDSGAVNLNEERFTSADGAEHFIQTKKTPFVSADGSQMLVGVIRDITDRKQYEAAREAALVEAQRLARMRSEFIAHMSHELRTPLNGILGYAQMLGRDSKLDEKQHASMDVIRQSGEHLLALIDDILDLARIESGKLELDMSDIPLARFLNVVAGIVGVRARQKQLEFVCEFAPDLPEGIRGDEKRLRQVLLNLLSNAVKFTDSGKVTLSVSRVTPSRLAFAVADTGIGIAPSDRETIFQSFEQVSDTQHRLGGTGLGLSISRQLVRLMGGDIVVESRPGEGSTFRFELALPEVEHMPSALLSASADEPAIEPDGEAESDEPLIAPPPEEIQSLHRLALLGNMRDIVDYAERIVGIDPRYRPFAGHLKRLANSYQSKAILALAEEHLLHPPPHGGDTVSGHD